MITPVVEEISSSDWDGRNFFGSSTDCVWFHFEIGEMEKEGEHPDKQYILNDRCKKHEGRKVEKSDFRYCITKCRSKKIFVAISFTVIISLGACDRGQSTHPVEMDTTGASSPEGSVAPLIETNEPVPAGKIRFATRLGYVVMRKLKRDDLNALISNVNVNGVVYLSNGEFRTGKPGLSGRFIVYDDHFCITIESGVTECSDVYVDDAGRHYFTEKGMPVARNQTYQPVQKIDN